MGLMGLVFWDVSHEPTGLVRLSRSTHKGDGGFLFTRLMLRRKSIANFIIICLINKFEINLIQ